MATQLVIKREELKAKQAALAAIFEQAGPDLDLGKAEALKASRRHEGARRRSAPHE